MRAFLSCGAILWCVSNLCGAQAPEPVSVVRAGTLIDGVSAQPRHNQDIVIRGNHIIEVSAAGAHAPPDGAKLIGIPVASRVLAAFAIAGLLAGFDGGLWASRYATIDARVATGFELTVIAAVVVGGVAIRGGAGVKNPRHLRHGRLLWRIVLRERGLLLLHHLGDLRQHLRMLRRHIMLLPGVLPKLVEQRRNVLLRFP